ncbi:hypothetical protein JIN84_03925 [Luteolibacter yonseiensis]|uniref:CHASE2 domain-containing protein n=1 Tax=Luteolibacter yonseiensis TaxID=1144680 RepID=A0A934V679_9BACT|nr:hypothetical protein [Luteolibacter yonseiensis]MBK1814747.1 hypothetical protein [Luteolibacter yonseiensis]
MTGSLQRRLCVLLASSAAAFGVWKSVPGTQADRVAFTSVVRGFANPPLFVDGGGTHAAPWKLRTFSSESRPDPREAPVIVSLGDDLENFFQSNPPAPIDFAVIFSNFQRLGAKKAANAAVLAWENPDPIAFIAFEKSMEGFDSLVLAAPLSRGAVAEPIPPAFRRASVPFASIAGDGSDIPKVNRIPLPNVALGRNKPTAGFSVLESEESSTNLPLLARWEDRVVFAFPLLTMLQRLDLPVEGMEIRPGEVIRLSPQGPVVPIDRYGRLATPGRQLSAIAEISAEALINGGDDLFPKNAPDPVILRDDRTAAEPATRAFSRQLSTTIAAIASENGLAPSTAFPRLPQNWELGILGVVVLFLTALCGAGNFTRTVTFIVLAAFILIAQWIALGMASTWLPGPAMLAAVLGATLVSLVIGVKSTPPGTMESPQVPSGESRNSETLSEKS